MFSKTFGYALRAVTLVAIHGQNGQKIGLSDLATQLEIPRPFLGKIMQDLVRHGILASVKGPNGGFYANPQTPETPLIDILKITDGSLIFNQCALNLQGCNAAHPCPLHEDFKVCRDGMIHALAQKTIGTLAYNVEEGAAVLVRHTP